MKIKFGFTLMEMLVIMVVIGLISAAGLNIFRQYDKGIRYVYSSTYHTLDRAVYNSMNFSDLPKPFVTTDLDDSGATITVTDEMAAERLCNMLIEYINTEETDCRSTNLANDSGTALSTPQFIASNGVRYYITKRLPSDKASEEPYFFIIYADTNGDKRPNSLTYEVGSDANGNRTVDPDIFAFAVVPVDGARICPLGPPEIDGRYMLTRVQYYEIIESADAKPAVYASFNDEEETSVKYSKVSLPYYITKAQAWGYYIDSEGVDDATYLDADPYTYNGYIKSKLPEGNAIYAFLGGQPIPRVPSGVTLMSASIEDGGYGCKKYSDEECALVIDRYLY